MKSICTGEKRIKTEPLMKAEALFYLWSDGLTVKQLRDALSVSQTQWIAIEEQLETKYGNNSGIVYAKHGDTRLFVTHEALHDTIAGLLHTRPQKSLSRQALEVLSIIAYKQPTTRMVVEQIRGVQSAGIIETLLGKNLIQEAGRLETIGKPYLYKTTDEFLRYFSLSDLSELPPLEETENDRAD